MLVGNGGVLNFPNLQSAFSFIIQFASRVSTMQLFYEVTAYFEFGFKPPHFL